MAHEKLRFNILLKNKDLNNNNSANDPIYSDTKYGTHYSIYAKIIGTKTVDPKGKDCFKVDSMNFYIQNFSGSVTLGITKVVGIESRVLNDDFNIKGFSSGRHLKCLLIMQGFNNDFSYDFKPQNNNGGILYEGDLLEIEVVFEAIENKISSARETDQDLRDNLTLYVDTEFMERDGESIVFLKGGEHKMKAIDDLKNGHKSYDEFKTILGPSRECKMKMSDIYIN